MAAPSFVVGIDLGTTNSAIAEADATVEASRPRDCAVPQVASPGEVRAEPLLPSFLYLPGPTEFRAGAMALPWDATPPVVGRFARDRGAENPARLVSSAKSWLSQPGVDGRAAILPYRAPDDVQRVSPVRASAAYLRHLGAAWTQAHEGLALADQDVFLTVPASFDEEARELTVAAAAEAGLPRAVLLEEPQAAFYAWLAAQGERWRDRVTVGDLVLVCDVGGGTTDFTLIAITDEGGSLTLTRVAVGDHILLGGDNMDLALAYRAQERLEEAGHRLDTWQFQQLWHASRGAKERLFDDAGLDRVPVTVLGRGSKLVGGTIGTELTRADVRDVLLDGFFPVVDASARPARPKRTGLQEIGLPYAADAAVTRHLARFLGELAADGAHASAPLRRGRSGMALPTHVLFNGGVMKAAAIRERLLGTLNGWLKADGFPVLGESAVLEGPDLDRAVAIGAAYYGLTRRGRGVRIRSGAARTYYIGIEPAIPAVPGVRPRVKALAVVPFGMEEGTEATLPDQEFGLVVGEAAEFRFLASTIRKQDAVGTFVESWREGELEELTPLETTLALEGHSGAVLPVRLESRVTEVGILELWLVTRDGRHRWKLEWNIRERR